MKALLLATVAFLVPLAGLDAADPPAVTINLRDRHGHVTPVRQGFTHTGGGNIDVAQPSPDTLVITMTGVAVAGAHPCKDSVATLSFDLTQGIEVAFGNAKVKKASLTIEGRVIGLLRSHKGGGSAEFTNAAAVVSSGPASVAVLTVEPHSVACGDNLSLNDHPAPVTATVSAGPLTLHQSFTISASHPRCLRPTKAASAEFAPDPALDPLWISYWEPFHGAAKKDLGFQVTIKVADEK